MQNCIKTLIEEVEPLPLQTWISNTLGDGKWYKKIYHFPGSFLYLLHLIK